MKNPLILLAASCGCALLALGICGQGHTDQALYLGLGLLGLAAVGAVVAILWMLGSLLMGSGK
ncbi:hypothetical protein [Terriglobus roseus]|nr:hypothetical protein [Terriglobus roseus]